MIFEDGTRRVYPLRPVELLIRRAAGGQLTPAPASPLQGHLTLGVIGSSEVRRGSWVEVKPFGNDFRRKWKELSEARLDMCGVETSRVETSRAGWFNSHF